MWDYTYKSICMIHSTQRHPVRYDRTASEFTHRTISDINIQDKDNQRYYDQPTVHMHASRWLVMQSNQQSPTLGRLPTGTHATTRFLHGHWYKRFTSETMHFSH